MSNAMTHLDKSRELRVKEILIKLELSPDHLFYVKSVNPSSGLPYHGYQHLLTVAIACFNSGEYYFYTDISKIRILFLAGLYHDWNHSGGHFGDIVNIARAIVGMTQSLADIESFDEKTISEIANLIAATEFPLRRLPKTQSEKIILDSDKLQWAENDFSRWSEGLSKELNRTITWENTKKFLSMEVLYTSWAKTRLFEKGLANAAW